MKLIGALTSKPYAFKARPWELENISTIDYHDANGTNIEVSIRSSQIMRILPKINMHLNDEWISDKVRFSYDGFSRQRIFHPMLKINNKLEKISWQRAFEVIKDKFDKGYFFEGIYGGASDAESILIFKELLNKIGNSTINNVNLSAGLDISVRSNYLLNSDISNSTSCLLIGTNPRFESPLFNLKLRKNVLQNNLKIFILGYPSNLTYDVTILANSTKSLISIVEGRNLICTRLLTETNPTIIIGLDIIQSCNLNKSMLYYLRKLVERDNWNGFNVLHQTSTTVIGAELGCTNIKHEMDYLQSNKVLYIYNSDDIIVNDNLQNFIIYQGHSADRTAIMADLILPGSAIVEKNGTVINNQGIKQKVNFCIKPPAAARNDWKIFEALGNYLGLNMEYLKIKNIENKLNYLLPNRTIIESLVEPNIELDFVNNTYINSPIANFYMTDSISRNSRTMALASNRFKKPSDNFIN